MYLKIKERCREKRIEGTITHEDLEAMVLEQNGLCAISRIPMNFRHLTDWQCSIERKDNNLGYTYINCVLICLEFQSSDYSRRRNVNQDEVDFTAQWTPELYNEVFWPNGGQENAKNWVPETPQTN